MISKKRERGYYSVSELFCLLLIGGCCMVCLQIASACFYCEAKQRIFPMNVEQRKRLFSRKRVDNKFMRGYYWLRGYVTCRIVLIGLSPSSRAIATRHKLQDWYDFSFRNQQLYYSFQNGFNVGRYGLACRSNFSYYQGKAL